MARRLSRLWIGILSSGGAVERSGIRLCDRSVFEPQAGMRDLWRRSGDLHQAEIITLILQAAESRLPPLPSFLQTAPDVGGGAVIMGRPCPTSGHASNDKCGANISSLDNLGIKSPRPAIIRWCMNET
jgi:hypothetical protein